MCGITENTSLNSDNISLPKHLSSLCATRISICSHIAAMTSTGSTVSNLCLVLHSLCAQTLCAQTIFNSATISLQSSCKLRKKSFSFFGGRGGKGGATGFNKSKPDFLSVAVHAEGSTTTSSCVRKGSPSITGVPVQRPDHPDRFEVQTDHVIVI